MKIKHTGARGFRYIFEQVELDEISSESSPGSGHAQWSSAPPQADPPFADSSEGTDTLGSGSGSDIVDYLRSHTTMLPDYNVPHARHHSGHPSFDGPLDSMLSKDSTTCYNAASIYNEAQGSDGLEEGAMFTPEDLAAAEILVDILQRSYTFY